MRWQNNHLSLRRPPASAIGADLPNECLTVAAGHLGVRYHGYHLCDLDRSRFLVEPRGFEPLTSWLQTIGATVSEGHWRRWAGRWQWLENTKRQGGCCTFVLHRDSR
jgi:hypothetical protein